MSNLHQSQHSLLQRFLHFLQNTNELLLFKHTVFALPFIIIALIISSQTSSQATPQTIALSILAAICARSFAMGFNRYLDRDIDALNPRTTSRPSVDGRISLHTQRRLLGFWAMGFVLCAYYINTLAFYLSAPVLALLAFYSYCKRFTPLAHLVLGFCLGISPMAGDIAISGTIHPWSLSLGIGVAFWVAGFDILYALQDMDFDKNQGLFSIPSVLGEAKAFYVVHGLHTLTVLAWGKFVYEAHLNWIAYMTLGLCALMLGYENYIAKADRSNINKAFFTINGYIGFIMLAGVALALNFAKA